MGIRKDDISNARKDNISAVKIQENISNIWKDNISDMNIRVDDISNIWKDNISDMNIRVDSGVEGGASGASADAPTVGHRWQSDTDASLMKLFKKKKRKEKKEAEKRKKMAH